MIENLICSKDGLGYCCLYGFFGIHRKVSTTLIAARIGVTPRAIRLYRARFNSGELNCEDNFPCLKELIKTGRPEQP